MFSFRRILEQVHPIRPQHAPSFNARSILIHDLSKAPCSRAEWVGRGGLRGTQVPPLRGSRRSSVGGEGGGGRIPASDRGAPPVDLVQEARVVERRALANGYGLFPEAGCCPLDIDRTVDAAPPSRVRKSLNQKQHAPLPSSLFSLLSGGRPPLSWPAQLKKLSGLSSSVRASSFLRLALHSGDLGWESIGLISHRDSGVHLLSTMSDPGKGSNMQQLVPMAPPARVSGGDSGKELMAKASGGGSGKELVLAEGGGKSSGGVKLREDVEDLEVKLRRIMEHVPVRVSNTSGSSAGSGSGDFHQYRQMRRREQDRITRMESDYEKRKQVAEFNLRREERLKAAEERTSKKRLKRQKKKERKKEKKTKTSSGGEEPNREIPNRVESSDDDEGSDYEGDDKFKQCI